MQTTQYAPHQGMFINKKKHRSNYNMGFFHFHKKYELYFLQEGTRRYFVNDQSYLVSQGNTVILGIDDIHKTGCVDEAPHTRYVINFGADYIQPLLNAFPGVNPLEVFDHQVHVLSTSLKDTHHIERMFDEIWRLQENDKSPESQAQQMLLLYQLLLFLNDSVGEQLEKGASEKQVNHPTIDKVVSYITNNYKEDLTLDHIASEVFISPSYLSRLFKKTTNLSIVEYINVVRIRAARELLQTTHMQISEISEEVGYSTPTHFSRVFKKSTGLSPSQYYKKYGLTSKSASGI